MDHPHVIKNKSAHITLLDDENVSCCLTFALGFIKNHFLSFYFRSHPSNQIFIKSATVIHIQAVIRVIHPLLTVDPTP